MPRFSPDVLRDFIESLFVAAGAPPDEACAVAASLVESNLRGYDSHGVLLARWYLSQIKSGELVPGASFAVLTESPALVAADGSLGFGQVQCARLVDLVSAKARSCGIAGGSLRRCGHVGRLGEWVERAAASNLAALIAVNDNGVLQLVAPPGGIAPRISTNPIAIAVPTGDRPLVLDTSTSAVANGKLRIARLEHRPVPLGWIQDAQGHPTTDPNVMLADPPGTLLPFGGDQAYKGFGLGLVFDILIGGLSGGFCPPAPPGTKEWNNVLLVVWDPVRFAGAAHFAAEADKLLNAVRGTPRKPGVDRIQLPGDRSAQERVKRVAEGIPLAADVWEQLTHVAASLGVPAPIEEGR
ncbi:MAG TPA: Ldh family oxidoreductase [Planctomycetaceae bacterium]|nr:Ldh family oxidoreductase [Planctomycetaceae bacterium]